MAENPDGTTALADKISGLMPQIVDELKAMVALPSVAFPAFPSEPVNAMAARAVAAFRRYGVQAHLEEIPGGYPAVWAEIPGPAGAPTALLYGHYDVQPAPKDQGWDTEPFVPTEKDGRIFGRGAADDKSGIAIHLATLAAFDGKPPVGVKLVLEGEEETVSHLEAYVAANPELFPRRPHGRRRHGQPDRRRAGPHHRPAGPRQGDRRALDAAGPGAFRAVRRRRA